MCREDCDPQLAPQVPKTTRATYTVMDVDVGTGIVSCLTDSGEVKDDLDLPKNEQGQPDEVGKELIEKWEKSVESGAEVKITVLSIMGREMILEVVSA